MDKGFEKKEEEVEDKKDGLDNKINDEKFANKLCCISLFLYLVTITYKWILPFFDSIFYTVNNAILVQLLKLLYIIIGVAPLGAYVIMIIVRIRYPKNKFGKILMILYNLSMLILFIWIYITLKQCLDGCNDWPG